MTATSEIKNVATNPQALPASDAAARQAFTEESMKPIREITATVRLNRYYTPAELGSYRILFQITPPPEKDYGPALLLAGHENYMTYHDGSSENKVAGLIGYTWTFKPDNKAAGGLNQEEFEPSTRLLTIYGTVFENSPYKTIQSFDHQSLVFYITPSLIGKIEGVIFVVNGYVLFASRIDPSALREVLQPEYVPWFDALPKQEQIKWRVASEGWRFDFGRQIPKLLSESNKLP